MATKSWIITGGNAGLGYECARFLLLDSDHHVVIACRDSVRAEAAAARLRRAGASVSVATLDLADLASVQSFPEQYRAASVPPLAGLICNAGVQTISTPTRTREGFETTFGVNHLGHYLLTRLMLAELQANGSITFVSSNVHDPTTKTGIPAPVYTNTEDLAHDFEPGQEAGQRRYSTSKLCNIYCAYELARRLAQSSDSRLRSLRVNAFDPGMMPGTGLARTYPALLRFLWNHALPALTLFRRNVNRPSLSGKRLAALASGKLGLGTGKYFSEGKEAHSSKLSYDKANAEECWTSSAKLLGLPVNFLEAVPGANRMGTR